MCGIHGINWHDPAALNKMLSISNCRGPDLSGTVEIDLENGSLGLAHNLLAITEDPWASAQPWSMPGQNSGYLCYNGEIWNHEPLRSAFEDEEGCRFTTTSDTQVLAHGLYLKGEKFLHEIDGMFAIAWYRDNKLTLARDQVGVKPLYYAWVNDRIAFSSSIKSLLSLDIERNLDPLAYSLYRTFGFVPGPRTLIQGIRKLCPGEVMNIDLRDNSVSGYNLNVPYDLLGLRFLGMEALTQEGRTFSEQFIISVFHAVTKCLMGKRKIGLFLSGGLDSSMILHEMKEFGYLGFPRTYTTRFDCKNQKFNSDADIAKRMAKEYGTDHTELLVTKQSFMDAIEPCVDALEEPRYNRSSPAYYLLNERVSQDGIIVTLSGDGGDEAFTGYPRHRKVNNKWSLKQWFNITRISRHIPYHDIEPLLDWVPKNIFNLDPVNNHLIMESICHLPEDFLIRNDRLGMNFGMEARFPFAGKKFRNIMLGIPAKDKMDKKMVKESYRGILPDYVLNKPKTGWAIPADEWIESDDFQILWMRPVLSNGYHPETDALLQSGPLKSIKDRMSMFYFRIWAKRFDIKYESVKSR